MLKTGAQMEIIPKMLFSFPKKLLEYLEEKQINYIDWVPSALCIVVNTGALENFQPSYLKKIMFCGEAMPTKQFNQWRENIPMPCLRISMADGNNRWTAPIIL